MKKLLFILLLIPFLLFSCSKEKSKKWIIFDLKVMNADNGNPVVADFRLDYNTKGGVVSGGAFSEQIGSSDANGRFYKELKIPRKAYNFKLSYYSFETALPPNLIPPESTKKIYLLVDEVIKRDKINKFNVIVKPIYKFYLHLNNINCFNDTDTLWATDSNFVPYQDVQFWTGCTDTILGGPAVSYDPIFKSYFKLKRNGVVSHLTKEINFIIDSPPYEFNY